MCFVFFFCCTFVIVSFKSWFIKLSLTTWYDDLERVSTRKMKIRYIKNWDCKEPKEGFYQNRVVFFLLACSTFCGCHTGWFNHPEESCSNSAWGSAGESFEANMGLEKRWWQWGSQIKRTQETKAGMEAEVSKWLNLFSMSCSFGKKYQWISCPGGVVHFQDLIDMG